MKASPQAFHKENGKNRENRKQRKIGLPRAFAAYLYPRVFETFLGELGFDLVPGEHTTQTMLEASALFSESEHCLSHKVFDAQLFSLIGRADTIFIPRILSMTRKHVCCAKFGAIPDASRCVLMTMGRSLRLADTPTVLTLDINETREPFRKTLSRFALSLGATRADASRAVTLALKAMQSAIEGQIMRNEALPERGRFLLIGHSYTLGEPLIMEPILKKIRALGIPAEIMTFEARPLPYTGGFSPYGGLFSFEMPTPIRWCSFSKIEEKLQTINPEHYAGVVQIGVFNCGPDSIMTELFRLLCAERGIPFLALMLDEHAGSAGIETRIEAFADSLEWRRGYPNQCA
jgi:predicted nucleotide-binding protein (sugar kinase/HSP70/actin superfamily)